MPKSVRYLFKAFSLFWENSFNFTSISSRRQYWLALIDNYFILFILYGLAFALYGVYQHIVIAFSIIYSVLLIIPGMSIVCRRYTDINHPYWYGLIWESARLCLRLVFLVPCFVSLLKTQGTMRFLLPDGTFSLNFYHIITNTYFSLGIIMFILIIIIDLINLKALCTPSQRKTYITTHNFLKRYQR